MAGPAATQSRDYRAHMQCAAGDGWMPRAVDQIACWLREKHLDVDLEGPSDLETAGATLSVRRISDAAGEDFSLNLVESNDTGRWTTALHVHDEPNGSDWITLSVRSGHGGFVNVPRLARYLMQVLPLGDASIEFTDRHQLFRGDAVDRLVALLQDPTRHGLVFVAGMDDRLGIPVPTFAEKVGDWAKEVYGLAQVVVLDPAASRDFQSRVGERFSAPPWTIRTYHPGVRFDDPLDARRHRILGTESLASRKDHDIRRLLGDIARQQAATRPEDPAVLRARRRLERFENRRLLEALQPVPAAPETSPSPSTPVEIAAPATGEPIGAELALVKRILGLETITEESLIELLERARQLAGAREAVAALQQRVEDLQTIRETLEDDAIQLREAVEDAQLEAELVRLDLDDREARLRWLKERLKDHNDFEASYAETPSEFQDSRPKTFGDLLKRIDSLDSVEFTGDVSEVERLNQIDTNDAALRTAWEAVLALNDYVRARATGACTQGLPHYISHTPSGYRTFPKGKFAETETGITMQGHGKERIFSVPAEVTPQRQIAMKAHFKLARIGMASPRMHIYDGNPQIPKVYIGYIGAHLTNTQTN